MPTLTICRGHFRQSVAFEAPAPLAPLLEQAGQGLMRPCGGRGLCGKCAVVAQGAVSPPNAAEKRCGTRLACQLTLLGDASVTLPEAVPMAQIAMGRFGALAPVSPMPGRLGAAVDVGTTTLAVRLYDLHTGCCLGSTAMRNPQLSTAADVIGRIDAAMHGAAQQLKAAVEEALQALLAALPAGGGAPEGSSAPAAPLPEAFSVPPSLVITGNTTMLYLLTGRDPAPLSRAPFEADCLFGQEHTFCGSTAYLPPCLHAFVGADTACALLACGMAEGSETVLLVDIGTNGEMVLRHRGQLYAASAAAGPAFEGAGISCGVGSVPGAIDRVWTQDGRLCIHTIGDKPPVGICGSGLVDAVAALLRLGLVDETGAMEADACPLAGHVVLTRQDIRAVQLAKAAIAAGVQALLHAAGVDCGQVSRVYVAGGFGSRLQPENAAAIGLLPQALAARTQPVDNAALDGAAMLLLDTSLRETARRLAAGARHVRLDGNPFFAARYVEEMLLQ